MLQIKNLVLFEQGRFKYAPNIIDENLMILNVEF